MTTMPRLDYTPADSAFGAPFIDIDEWRETPRRHRYVHGGFEGTHTLFSFYFPPPELYRGRLFQLVDTGGLVPSADEQMFSLIREQSRRVISAVQTDIQIPVARDLNRRDPFDRVQSAGNFRRHYFRRFPQLPRQLERGRQRDFAERRLLGLLRLCGPCDAVHHLNL